MPKLTVSPKAEGKKQELTVNISKTMLNKLLAEIVNNANLVITKYPLQGARRGPGLLSSTPWGNNYSAG